MNEEEMFFMLNDYIDKNFILVRRGDDFCIFFGDKVYTRMVNCKDVSEDFIKYYYESVKEIALDDGIDGLDGEPDVVDMRELVDEWIREELWDWRKEVKEYKGHDGLLVALSVEEDGSMQD